MRLSCRFAFLVFAATTIACTEPLTPSSVSGYYELETVNGQPLPVIIGPIPEETITVLEGSVTLTTEATAYTFERRREVRQNVPSERTYLSNRRFVLDGNKIGFPIDCPINANCISVEGVILWETLRIAIGGFASPNAMIYEYRLAPNRIVPAG
jgi:hypothetical protein